MYPQYGGGWKCDLCDRDKSPDMQEPNVSKPYHCEECQFDACHECVNRMLGRGKNVSLMLVMSVLIECSEEVRLQYYSQPRTGGPFSVFCSVNDIMPKFVPRLNFVMNVS